MVNEDAALFDRPAASATPPHFSTGVYSHCYTKKLANLAASVLLYLLKKCSVNT